MSAKLARWRALEDSISDTAHFEDGTLVLDALSWDTHFLNPEATLVFELVRGSARTETELAEELLVGQAMSARERQQYLLRVRKGLEELSALGLIGPEDGQDS